VLVGSDELKRSIGRLGKDGKIILKHILKEIGWRSGDWIQLA
jgi:hypothetical protein